MTNTTSSCRMGVIVDYYPSRESGSIRDHATNRLYEFYIRYVSSDLLRTKLAQTNRFEEENVVLQPNIYVTYRTVNTGGVECAYEIEPLEEIGQDIDYGAPVVGYLNFCACDRDGRDGFMGWINAEQTNNSNGSSYLSDERVIDPVLKAYLLETRDRDRNYWYNEAIRVRYWNMESGRGSPTAICVAYADDRLRESLIQRNHWVGNEELARWEEVRGKYLDVPADLTIPEYVPPERPTGLRVVRPAAGGVDIHRMAMMTDKEREMLERFKEEAKRITVSNPAQREQLNALWPKVLSCQQEEYEAMVNTLPGIANSKLDKICRAASHYLAHRYGDAIEMSLNAYRYDLAAYLAASIGEYALAQVVIEQFCLTDEPNAERIDMLGNTAQYTHNADALCTCLEMLMTEMDASEAEDICGNMIEVAVQLLMTAGMEVDEEPDPEELLQELRRCYSNELPTLEELRQAVKTRYPEERSGAVDNAETDAETDAEPDLFRIPDNRLATPNYYRANTITAARNMPPTPVNRARDTTDAVKECFGTENEPGFKYRVPDSGDTENLPLLDDLLNAEHNSLTVYTMPMLLRICLDANGSEMQIRTLLDRLEQESRAKRKEPKRDRRWRLFNSLLQYVQAAHDREREAAWESAKAEANSNDEKRLIDALPH